MPRNLFSMKLSGSAAWQVLGNILSYANVDGTNARPKIRTIVTETSLSRRSVMYAIKELEEVGLLARKRRRKDGHQDSSLYAIDKTSECTMLHSAGCNSSAPLRPDPFLPDPSATTVAASFSQKMPSMRAQLIKRGIELFEDDRDAKGARTAAVTMVDYYGEEMVQEAFDEVDPKSGTSVAEMFATLASMAGGDAYIPNLRPPKKPKPAQPMPSFSEMRRQRETAPMVDFKTAWRDPRLWHHALEYGRGRGLSDKEINQHFDVYEGRNEDLVRNDWLLNWTMFLGRRLRPAPANPWAMSRY